MKKILVSVLVSIVLLTTIAIPAFATEAEDVLDASVSIGEVISLTLVDAGIAGINFGTVTASDTAIYGDINQAEGTPAVIVRIGSETNVAVDISIMGSTSDVIPLDKWQYSTLFDKTDIAGLTDSYVVVYDEQGPGDYPFYQWITVPASTGAGDYAAQVAFMASND